MYGLSSAYIKDGENTKVAKLVSVTVKIQHRDIILSLVINSPNDDPTDSNTTRCTCSLGTIDVTTLVSADGADVIFVNNLNDLVQLKDLINTAYGKGKFIKYIR